MNKLALIGKNIQHSKSPEIYRKIISPHIIYDLLDYETELKLPTAIELLRIYDGINITSPYKEHFLNQVELSSNAKKLGAINCLKKIGNKIIGENTDYLAILDILREFQHKHGKLKVVILGDGVMSKVTISALSFLGYDFEVLSRKKTKNFDQLDLEIYFSNQNNQPLVINTCSRDYIFSGKIDERAIFWDFNYDFSPHTSSLSAIVKQYLDGYSMLFKQAEYALAFWSSK